MLQFMKRKSVNFYYLNNRFGDCEPNLICFNYITPMAVCVETMIKSMWIEYKNEPPDDIETRQLYVFLHDSGFRTWMREQYDISEKLVDDVDRLIRKESNKFKHSLTGIPTRSVEQKKTSFYCFYSFSAKYYKKKTGEDAPEWSESDFYDLMKPEIEKSTRKIYHVSEIGGKEK